MEYVWNSEGKNAICGSIILTKAFSFGSKQWNGMGAFKLMQVQSECLSPNGGPSEMTNGQMGRMGHWG